MWIFFHQLGHFDYPEIQFIQEEQNKCLILSTYYSSVYEVGGVDAIVTSCGDCWVLVLERSPSHSPFPPPPLILFNVQFVPSWPRGNPSCCLLDFNMFLFIFDSFLTFWYKCCRFILHISCHRPGISYSLKESWFLFVEKGF